jgi:hypothetical protein
MLWNYRGSDNVIDDEFELLNEYFSAENESVKNNIELLENLFDCWCNMSDDSPSAFLEKYISYEHTAGKIKIDRRYQIDVFKDCLQNYADIIGGRNRKFPLNRIVLLYGIVEYLLHKDTVTEDEFTRRLRVINNLIQNSEDEISDSESRVGGNRMPAILSQVDAIILTGAIDTNIERSFNQYQLEEENEKIQWCKENPETANLLFELEDHELLYGQVGIVGVDPPELFFRFKSLFMCSWDAIDCALLATGDYIQTDRNGWRHQMGSSSRVIDAAWKTLFHKSANDGYKKTFNTLRLLLSKTENFTDVWLQEFAANYLAACENRQEYDWRYYYIKYPSFRLGRYGKYCWKDYNAKQYELLALWTEHSWSSNARQPFLYEIDESHINRDDNGWNLFYDNVVVKCENSAFVIIGTEKDEEIDRIEIMQNEKGIDIEDRIIIGNKEIPTRIASLKPEVQN